MLKEWEKSRQQKVVIHYNSCCARFLSVSVPHSSLLCCSHCFHYIQAWFLSFHYQCKGEIVHIADGIAKKKSASARANWVHNNCFDFFSIFFCAMIIDGIRYVALYRCHGNCHLVNLLSCHYHDDDDAADGVAVSADGNGDSGSGVVLLAAIVNGLGLRAQTKHRLICVYSHPIHQLRDGQRTLSE